MRSAQDQWRMRRLLLNNGDEPWLKALIVGLVVPPGLMRVKTRQAILSSKRIQVCYSAAYPRQNGPFFKICHCKIRRLRRRSRNHRRATGGFGNWSYRAHDGGFYEIFFSF